MEDTKGLSERLLSSNHLLCCSHYGISIQTVFFHELCRSTTLAEAVVYGYEFLRHGVVGYQSLSNALAQTTKTVVLFSSHNTSCFRDRSKDCFLVQRLNSSHAYHFCTYACSF